MKISVIVPVYNGQDVLRKCIDSILGQTHSDIEIVIVNDGSTDSTRDIVEDYKKKYSNVVVIHKQNEGLPQARKTGVEASTGQCIGFVDADDWIEPDMYSRLYEVLEKYHADVSCTGYFIDYGRGEKIAYGSKKEFIYDSEHALKGVNQRKYVLPFAWNKLYHRTCFEGVDYPVGNIIGEDYAIVTQVLSKAKRVVWIEQPLYHYIRQKNSMSLGGFNRESFFVEFESYKFRMNAIKEKFPQLSQCVNNYLITELLCYVTRMGRNNNYDDEALKIIKRVVKRDLLKYVFANYIELKYKMSAIGFALNYRFLVWAYRLLYKF